MASSILNDSAPTLIVGGDSMIGRALAARLEADGQDVFVTTRRRDALGDRRLFVDLDTGEWGDVPAVQNGDRPFAVACLCAAMARLDACHAAPEQAMRINAIHMTALAAALAAGGCYVVLLSTNQVFDGTTPAPLPATPVCPTSAYGRSKAAAEQGVLALSENPSVPPPGVLRLSKVVEPGMALLTGWDAALRRGETVRAAHDMTLAPLPVAQVTQALRAMAAQRTAGIVQLAAGGEITYLEAARHLARRAGARDDQVQPVSCVAAGFLKEPPPPHTLLNGDRARRELGIEPVNPFAVLDDCLAGTPSPA